MTKQNAQSLWQVTELPFFATKVRLGRNGADEIYQLGPLNEYERYVVLCYTNTLQFCCCKIEQYMNRVGSFLDKSYWFMSRVGLEKAKRELAASIQKGVSFIKK